MNAAATTARHEVPVDVHLILQQARSGCSWQKVLDMLQMSKAEL